MLWCELARLWCWAPCAAPRGSPSSSQKWPSSVGREEVGKPPFNPCHHLLAMPGQQQGEISRNSKFWWIFHPGQGGWVSEWWGKNQGQAGLAEQGMHPIHPVGSGTRGLLAALCPVRADELKLSRAGWNEAGLYPRAPKDRAEPQIPGCALRAAVPACRVAPGAEAPAQLTILLPALPCWPLSISLPDWAIP